MTQYVLGHSALALSETFYDFVFAVLAFKISGHAFLSGAAYALGYLAEIIVSLLGGGILDKCDRRKLFNITMIAKFSVFLFFIFLSSFYSSIHQQSISRMILVLIFAFLIDMLHHTSRLANSLTLFQIFDQKSQITVQGMITSINGISKISGPLIAGSLLSWVTIRIENLLLFSLVLQVIAWIALNNLFNPLDHITKEQKHRWIDLALSTAKTVHKSFHNKAWRKLFLIESLGAFLLGTASLLFYPLFNGYYHFNEQECGILLSASAIGMVVGGFFLNPIYRLVPHYQIIIKFSLFLSGAMCAVFATQFTNLMSMMMAIIIFSTSTVSFFRSLRLILVDRIDTKELGQWWTASDVISSVSGIAGILIGSITMDLIGGTMLYGVIAVILCICSLTTVSNLKTQYGEKTS